MGSKKYHEIYPQILRLHTWVGYDVDGRGDIFWNNTFSKRLQVKIEQLLVYSSSISELLKDIACLIDPDDLETWEDSFIRASNDVEWLDSLSQNNTNLTSITYDMTAIETHRAYISTKNSTNR